MRYLPILKSKKVNEMMEFILKCPMDDLKELQINDIAGHFQMSRVHLQNLFKTEMNITIGKYITHEKLNRALIYLFLSKDITVKELSESMGFAKCDYFIELFKKHFGVPPSRYRELKIKQFLLRTKGQ